MNTSIVGRHIKLTDAIKDYINSSIDTFKKYNLDIIFRIAYACYDSHEHRCRDEWRRRNAGYSSQ